MSDTRLAYSTSTEQAKRRAAAKRREDERLIRSFDLRLSHHNPAPDRIVSAMHRIAGK